jgi:hypothetical protein
VDGVQESWYRCDTGLLVQEGGEGRSLRELHEHFNLQIYKAISVWGLTRQRYFTECFAQSICGVDETDKVRCCRGV